ncbi:MAG TPA: ergothioneine biosynthesis protein EgtB [Rhodanobacteraceae bacterium]|nr:ergothioneine biosynthesis protein EgtB [Rhodanobacteraceae bacterium]
MNTDVDIGTGRALPALADRYAAVRRATVELTAGMTAEDMVVQSMPAASPAKWHLAHTTWFFERFVLGHCLPGHQPYDEHFDYLFNSYYLSVGTMHPRAERGLLTRPSVDEVLAWRAHVDGQMAGLLAAGGDEPALRARIELGLAHEQQHQELLLTDIKHALSRNPLLPALRPGVQPGASLDLPQGFVAGASGAVEIGAGDGGFAFDNERPRHRVWLQPHALAVRPVSNADYRQFIDDGGYDEPALWLSDGWDAVQREQWRHPLYWADDLQSEFTLAGEAPIDPQAPVCHVGWFEADAFARWAGARLPREDEWEALAAVHDSARGNFADNGPWQPRAAQAAADGAPVQLFGDVWEWTASAYAPYPGFRPLEGSLGEYNGKFMHGQQVLRGGSCATPAGHVRASYRNFFHATDRWQFSGIRLARDA